MLEQPARSHLFLLTDYPTRNSHDSTIASMLQSFYAWGRAEIRKDHVM